MEGCNLPNHKHRIGCIMYIEVKDGVVTPVTLKQFRAAHPNVSFPPTVSDEQLKERGYFRVYDQPDPAFDPATQVLEAGEPVLVGETWQRMAVVVDKTAKQIAAEASEVEYAASKEVLKGDAAVAALLRASPNQIDSYIDANLKDLASARTIIKTLARAVSVLADPLLR